MASSRVDLLIAVLISGALLAIGCQGSSFTLSDVELSHETKLVVSDEKVVRDNSSITLSFATNTEDEYTYVLTSPSGEMSWDGSFRFADGRYVSTELLKSSTASFEKGKYTYYIYSSKQQEKSGKVELDYSLFRGPFFDENGFVDQSGLVLQPGSAKAPEGQIIGTDSYGGKVFIDHE